MGMLDNFDWGRFKQALGTMPSVESIKSGATLPGDVWSGKQPMGLPSQTEDLSRVGDLAGLVTTGGAASMAGKQIPAGAIGTFGGPLALSADLPKLQTAREMAIAGKPPKPIWKDTGWFQGADKNWRFEIPDNAASIPSRRNTGSIYEGPLSGILSHPQLFEAYPGLGKAETTVRSLPGPGQGSYWNRFPLDIESSKLKAIGDNPESLVSVLLHEGQHAIQGHEGFAHGSSPRLAQLRPEFKQLHRQQYEKLRENMSPRDAAYNARQAAAQDIYKRHAGEVEARNVQTRQNMSPALRRDMPPWQTQGTMNADQIIRYLQGYM